MNWLSAHLSVPENFLYDQLLKGGITLLLAFVSFFALKYILQPAFARFSSRTKSNFDDYLLEAGFINRLSQFAPAWVLYLSAGFFPHLENYIRRGAEIYGIIIFLLAAYAFLNAVQKTYNQSQLGKNRPITGIIQVIKLILWLITTLILISLSLDIPLGAIIGGLGAAMAILLLIFKDTIISFVSGIKIITSDLMKLGDWIEMPKFGADGNVIDITLHHVRIQNFDRTIITIPTTKFLEDSFKNWRGMNETGARRMKRSLLLDVSSISFAADSLLKKLTKIEYLKDYIKEKTKEIAEYNKKHKVDGSLPINGRRLTNIGLFRIYIREYLKHHPKIRQDLTLVVRQLEEQPHGVPLEIIAFIAETLAVHFESVQSDIFDHLYAAAPFFELRLFQHPTGYDYRARK